MEATLKDGSHVEGAAEGASQTSVGAMPYSARAQQLGSATEAVGYAHDTVQRRALYCTVGLQAS